MAKLHNEIRIRQVNGIAVGQEGQGDKFSDGDVVYVQGVGFKQRNGTAYNAGDAAASWSDIAGGGGGGGLNNLVEDTTPQLGGTLDANGNDIDMGANVITDTKVGEWDSAYTWGDHSGVGYQTAAQVSVIATQRVNDADLTNLSDVNVSGAQAPTDGQVLYWDNTAGEWRAKNEAGGGGATDLNALTDVTITGGGEGDILSRNGVGQYVNLQFSDIAKKKYEITYDAGAGGNYRITGPGLDGNQNNPAIYLVRGESYSFTNNAGASHPFDIENTNNTPYSDAGLTLNSLSNGQATSWTVAMDAPAQLQYQCSNHGGMKGDIFILDEGSGGGSSNQILQGNTDVTVTDGGSDGIIQFRTEGSLRWRFTSGGHLLPETNANYDIGSADKKVRHLFLSDNSLYVGESGKLTVREESLAIVKRKKNQWPSGITHEVGDPGPVATLNTYSGAYNFNINEVDPKTIDWSEVSLEHWVQLGQSIDPNWTVDNIFGDDDFEESDSDNTIKVSHQSSNAQIVKKFYVAVDNKDQQRYPEPYAAGHSVNAYYIDGHHAPELRLKKGRYRFMQSHISNYNYGGAGHPLAFLETNDGGGLGGPNALDSHIAKLDIDLEYGYIDTATGVTHIRSTWSGNTNTWTSGANDFQEYSVELNETNYNNGWRYYVDLTIREGTPREFYYVCGLHSKMGWKIINEDAQHEVLKSEVLAEKPNFGGGNVDYDIAPDLAGQMGGRIIIDTDSEGDRVSLDLNILNQNNFQKTFNFEIQSVGLHDVNDAFTVKVFNSGTPELKLNSYWQPDIVVAGGTSSAAGASLQVGGNQILVIWCDENKNVDPASCGWTYQLRTV